MLLTSYAVLVPTSIHVSMQGQANGTHQLFSSGRNLPKDPAPSAYVEISKRICLPYIPEVFQTATPILYLNGAICYTVSLRTGTPISYCPLALPAMSHWFLKLWVLSPTEVRPHQFKPFLFSKPNVIEIRLPCAVLLCLGYLRCLV